MVESSGNNRCPPHQYARSQLRIAGTGSQPRSDVQLRLRYSEPCATKASFLDNKVGTAGLRRMAVLRVFPSFSVGAPLTPSYTLTNASGAALNRLITGSEDFAPRVVLTCDPNKTHGRPDHRRVHRHQLLRSRAEGQHRQRFRYQHDSRTGIEQLGYVHVQEVPIRRRHSVIQLRVEAYNVFNHTNWTTLEYSGSVQSDNRRACECRQSANEPGWLWRSDCRSRCGTTRQRANHSARRRRSTSKWRN